MPTNNPELPDPMPPTDKRELPEVVSEALRILRVAAKRLRVPGTEGLPAGPLTADECDAIAIKLRAYDEQCRAGEAEDKSKLARVQALVANWQLELGAHKDAYTYTMYEQGRISEKRRNLAHLDAAIDEARDGVTTVQNLNTTDLESIDANQTKKERDYAKLFGNALRPPKIGSESE